jgi:hypothetical protein
VTGQVNLDSYSDTGVLVAVDLVNEVARLEAGSRGGLPPAMLPAIAGVLAVDPPSVAQLKKADVPGFVGLVTALRLVFQDLHQRDVDAAAARLNDLLSRHPAHPHLAKEEGRWRMHHHPMDSALVPMWSSICAEAMARMIGAGHADRFGTCEAPECGQVFFDISRNASRRFCSTTCQNRVKAAAFRLRQGSRPPASRKQRRKG